MTWKENVWVRTWWQLVLRSLSDAVVLEGAREDHEGQACGLQKDGRQGLWAVCMCYVCLSQKLCRILKLRSFKLG